MRSSVPSTLAAELDKVADRFGVDEEQVQRDHAISHVLGILSAEFADDVLFYDGTALSRTHLDSHRLSEDIDLIVPNRHHRWQVASALMAELPGKLEPVLGKVWWNPGFDRNQDGRPALLVAETGVAMAMQAIAGGYEGWPTERRTIEQRYSDAPTANLTVPTVESFVCMKTIAWSDRHAARDLYDLWALEEREVYSSGMAELYRKFGPTGTAPAQWMFTNAPTVSEWHSQLGAQTRLTIGPDEALGAVRRTWSSAVGQDWDEDWDEG